MSTGGVQERGERTEEVEGKGSVPTLANLLNGLCEVGLGLFWKTTQRRFCIWLSSKPGHIVIVLYSTSSQC